MKLTQDTENFDLSFVTFRRVFLLIVPPSVLSLINLKILKI